jgi:hypothetical protein
MIPYGEIFLDNKGVLIDGRNRAKAWDPPVLAIDVKRRHMSKGQQAMAWAMIYPDPEKGAVREYPEGSNFWRSRNSESRHRCDGYQRSARPAFYPPGMASARALQASGGVGRHENEGAGDGAPADTARGWRGAPSTPAWPAPSSARLLDSR